MSYNNSGEFYIYPDETHTFFNWYTVIVIIIVIILIIIILFVVYHRQTIYTPENMGIWGPEIIGQCETNTNLCSELGSQTITQECIPNSQTGRGCLVDDNVQTYSTRIKTQSCRPACRAYLWNTTTSDCQIPDIPSSQCVPEGVLGQQDVIKTCVVGDNTGNNYCIDISYTEYVDSLGGVSLVPQTVTYDVGESVTTTQGCSSFQNPICGRWASGNPIQYGSKTVNDFTSLVQCSFTSNLLPFPACTGSNQTIFNVLQEGFLARPLSCVTGSDVYTPTNIEPPLTTCPLNPNGGCTSTTITSNMITTSTLPSGFNGTVCGQSNNSQNPQCISSCRVFPGISTIGTGEMDIILNSIMILQITVNSPYDSYLAPYQYPSTNSNLILFRRMGVNSSQELYDVPLISVPNDLTFPSVNPSCSSGEIQFVSSMLFAFGMRSYNVNKLSGILLGNIGNVVNGWIMVDNDNNLFWRQAYETYNGPGTLSNTASIFSITKNGNVDTTPIAGMPSTFRGSFPVLLEYNNSAVYVINSITLLPISAIDCRLLLFENSTSFINRSSDTCSIYK